MEKIEFKTESKRILDLMINSIYTNKEIFLRELISNASDAIDKLYYKSLIDENLDFNREDFYIEIERDLKNRKLIIRDTGIGMNKKDLMNNLGVIARSDSLKFKEEKNNEGEDIDIIGQFGVGFYSAFMVADKVEVNSKKYDSNKAYKWVSRGKSGYTIEESNKDDVGTEIILYIKDNNEDENFDQFLEENKIIQIIKKYSDFIRYPIKMEITKVKNSKDGDMEEYREVDTINSMVPIWRKNKNELNEEDYINFYHEKHFGYDDPLRYIHFNVDGMMSYRALLYIPRELPFDFYTTDFEKGLELYSSGVMIMEKTSELLPDYFSFVKGVVDSEDLSLNISRELLQNNRQLQLMANKIESKIREELETLLKDNREEYELFYKNFGNQLKFGVYMDYGANKDKLEDLLIFYSSRERKMVSLKEYIGAMKEDQQYIYYATGESIDKIDKMPQNEVLKEKGYEILYLDEEIDEFAIKMLGDYDGKEFKSVSSGDLGIDEENEKNEEIQEENKDLFNQMKEILNKEVKDVRASTILKNHPVCLTSEGEVSIEMEKVLSNLPDNNEISASKVLEINTEHELFKKLQSSFKTDKEKFTIYTEVLYDQARLIEGLEIEDPIKFAENVSQLI